MEIWRKWSARVAILALSIAGIVGCSTSSPTQVDTSDQSSASKADRKGEEESARESETDVEKVAEVPLSFEVSGQRLPVPLVSVAIEGREVPMIVDSGSTHHVLLRSFTERVDLEPRGSGETGTDSAGESVRVRPLQPVTLALGEYESTFENVLATEGPPPLRKLGVSGFLAPHRLVDRGYVVVDFPEKQLTAYRGTAGAIRARRLENQTGWTEIGRRSDDGRFVVELALDDRDAVPAALDTGGSNTEFEVGYAADSVESSSGDDSSADGCEGSVSVGGTCVESRKLPGSRVRFAGGSFEPVEARLRETIGSDEVRARLGMDVARECAFAFPQTTDAPLLVRCSETSD